MNKAWVWMVAAFLVATSCGGRFSGFDLADERGQDPGEPVLSFVWKRVVHDRTWDQSPQEFAAPTVEGDWLYLGSHGGIFFSMGVQDGSERWQKRLGPMSSRAVVYRGYVYVGTDDGSLYALDTRNGDVKWEYKSKGAIVAPPVVAGDMLVFANNDDHVFALDLDTGKWRWQYERDTPEEFTVRGHAGVLVDGERVYCGFADGNLVALSKSAGEVLWVRSLAGAATRFVDVDTTPTLYDGVLYASSTAGGLWAIDPRDGSQRWHVDVAGAGPVAVDEGRIFFAAADQGLYALDFSGQILWRQGMYEAGDPSRPVVVGNRLFLSVSELGLYIVDKQSGHLLQHFNPGSGISSDPTISDPRLFVFSNAGILYSLHLNDV